MILSVLSTGFVQKLLEVPSKLGYNARMVCAEADRHFATIQSSRRGVPQAAAQH